MLNPIFLVLLHLSPVAASGVAPPPLDPCCRERLDDFDAIERNAWAHNCGYLPMTDLTWLWAHSLWLAFEQPGAPCDLDTPCSDAWGAPITFCPADLDDPPTP